MKNRVVVLHGVNLDALERRPPEVYGRLSLTLLEQRISGFAHELGLDGDGDAAGDGDGLLSDS